MNLNQPLYRSSPRGLIITLLVMLASMLQHQVAQSQIGSSSLPKANYFQAFGEYSQGDFTRAGRNFQRAYTSAFQQGEARFLDSACCLTMVGECHYQLGNYSDALTQYEQALQIYLALNKQNWQRAVQSPQALSLDTAALQRSKVNWATPKRNTSIPRMPSTFLVQFGRTDASRVFSEGGVFDQARARPVDINEIMRCVALAMHRRRQLLGPLNKITPLTRQLASGLAVTGAGDGSILGSYNGVLLGIALASSDRPQDAVRMLTSSLQIDAKYDHPLTPVALTELARLAIAAEKRPEAAALAIEASVSAGVWGQYDLVDESLSLGTANHLQTFKTPYPPLANAIQWCNSRRFRQAQYSLSQRLAECFAETGNAKAARNTIASSGSASRNRDHLKTVAGARMKYVAAMASFSEGDFAAGLSELSPALTQYQNGSLWLFRLRLVSDWVANRVVSELEADKLYSVLLRDPDERDWELNPIEPLSFLVSDHVSAMEKWFEILVRRRQFERALQVSELIRRHRFYSTLPMGGRLLAFRYSLNADESELDPATVAQRKRFLAANVPFQELINGATAIRDELKKLPTQPDADSDEARKQRQLLGQLARVSGIQEAAMASYALGRNPSNLAYPPALDLPSFQQRMPTGTLCLSALKTASGYHVFFVSRDRIRYTNQIATKQLDRAVTQFLRDLGAIGGSATETKTLNSEAWKESGAALKRGLFAGVPDESFLNLVELVIVPDGMLWYTPFAALPLQVDPAGDFLIDFCPVRFAPTMSLAVEAEGGKPLKQNTVAIGSMHSRGEAEMTIAEVETLRKTFPDLYASEKQTSPSGLSAWLTDHLMVWSESFLPANGFSFQPVPFEESQHASINSWMALPWLGPEYLSLPAIRTFGKGRKANGSEMFVTSVALMASGSRTVMLSRWPTGGAISLGLSRLYAEQLTKQKSASRALRQAMIEARDLNFDIEKEPQLKGDKDLGDLSAKHPFFWSSFFVVDQPRKTKAVVQANPVVPGAPVVPAVNPPVINTPAPAVNQPGPTSATPASPVPAAGDATSGSSTIPTPPAPDPDAATEEVEKPTP